jgi:tRNA pseudouridine55 synthase
LTTVPSADTSGDELASGVGPGVVLLDKPAERSSFSALGAVKRRLGSRKVGHTGTLDPFATGLMVVLIGAATKAAVLFSGMPKRYRAVFAFGQETDTLDLTGTVQRTAQAPSRDALRDACSAWVGSFEQTPPAFSAVHVDGKRSYQLARAGVAVAPKSRRVVISELELLDYRDGAAVLDVACSAGTYVRALARDIGRQLGSAAHVRELRRTEVGPFLVEESVRSDEYDGRVLPLLDALSRMESVARVAVPAELIGRISHGGAVDRDLRLEDVSAEEVLLHHEGQALALLRREGDAFRYRAVLAQRSGSG